jgi:DNA-binding LacI/PurR family transcriptional regulator
MRSTTKITAEAVAAAVNVSRATVSRAFDPNSAISVETRTRILKAADDIGYRPNAARNLNIQESNGIIALIFKDVLNPTRALMVSQLVRSLQYEKFLPLVFQISVTEGLVDMMESFLDYGPKAVIINGFVPQTRLVTAISRKGKPVVVLNRGRLSGLSASYVSSDHFGGGVTAARELIRSGASRFCVVTGGPDKGASEDRVDGFLSELEKQGRTLWSAFEGDLSYESGYRAAVSLLAERETPDGVFCSNDVMALGFLDAARNEFKRRVPDDLQVVGYDNVEMAGWSSHSLSTVAQNMPSVIEQTVDTVKALTEGTTERVARVIPTRFIARSTTRPPLSAE